MTLFKNKSFYRLILLTGIPFLLGCTKYKLESINNNSATLYNCSSSSTEPYICFDSLITDRRCPKPGVCFWSGTAVIKVSFHEKDNVHTFKMSLKGFPSIGYPNDTAIAGYRIVLIDLTPYLDFTVPSQASDIRATFNIIQ